MNKYLPFIIAGIALWYFTKKTVTYRLQQAATRGQPDIYTQLVNGADTQNLFKKDATGNFVPFI